MVIQFIKAMIIGLLDMDAFFAAVEERDNPKLRGFGVVVGSDPKGGQGRGVVSTANYVARRFGIHSAMPISFAWRHAQEGEKKTGIKTFFVPVDMPKLERESERVMKTLRRFSPLVEQASVDEAYFDLSVAKNYSSAAGLAREIKRAIREEWGLTCSIGIGPNKLIAKIASGAHKPDGLTVVEEKDVQTFLDKLDVGELPGVGPKTKEKLKDLGILSIRDLRRKMTLRNLETLFGKSGKSMYHKARGFDESPLSPEHEAKTIGASETFQKDTRNFRFIAQRISLMCEEIIYRLKQDGFQKFSHITLTVRFSDFETKDRGITLAVPLSSQKDLEFEITKLLMPFFDKRDNPKKKMIRLVGVRVGKLQ